MDNLSLNSGLFKSTFNATHSNSFIDQVNVDLTKLKSGLTMPRNLLSQKQFRNFSVSVIWNDTSGKIEVLKHKLAEESRGDPLVFKGIPKEIGMQDLGRIISVLETSDWKIKGDEIKFQPKREWFLPRFFKNRRISTIEVKPNTPNKRKKLKTQSEPHYLPSASKKSQNEDICARKNSVSCPESRNGSRLITKELDENNENPLNKECIEREILDFSKGPLNEWIKDKNLLEDFLNKEDPGLLNKCREINFSSIDKPLASFFKLLSTKCPNIDTIIIQSCNRINDIVFPALAQFKNLRKLDISNCNQISNKFLKCIVETFPQLVYLNLSSCKYITDDGLEHITHLENLGALNISNCNQITDQGLANLKNLKRLNHFWLSGCLLITDKGLEFIQKKQNLGYLDVSYLPKVTKDGLKKLFLWDGAYRLNVSGHDRLPFASFQNNEIGKINHLRELNLSSCSNIKCDDLLKINFFKNLKLIEMRDCFSITEKEADACLTKFKRELGKFLYIHDSN